MTVQTLPRLIDVAEFFADPVFSTAQLSPDGARVAYLAPAHGRMNVWVRGIGEEHGDARCVTDDARRGITAFCWSDDPGSLLYRGDADGNEGWHLYRVDLDVPGAEPVDLTPLPPGCRVSAFTLLPGLPGILLVAMNGGALAFGYYRVDIATGETVLHQEIREPRSTFLFDAAGTPVFREALTEEGVREYYAIDRVSGAERLLRRAGGAEHPLGVHPVLAEPDGTGLLLGSYQDTDDLRLVRVDAETGEETVVAAVAGHSLCELGTVAAGVAHPPSVLTSRHTGKVLAARFVGDRPRIEALDPHFAEVYAELAKLSDGVLAAVSSDRAEQRWVATFSHDRAPDLTYFYDHRTGESRLLFRPYPHLDPAELAPMTAVSFPARDGLPLHGFLTLPVGVEPTALPFVLLVHGGPWTHDSWRYDREAQVLANRGYGVLQVNFRGSTGYGRRHLTAAVGELGGKMHDDLIDATEWAVDQGYADPDRLGIYGGSYGGYAALVGVTVTPDHFAAAVDHVGMANLVSFTDAMPSILRPYLCANWHRYAGDSADPVQKKELLSRSPSTMVDRIRTPLLVVQGARDARVPKAESDRIVGSLRARGVPVDYLVADDEGHDFRNPENLIRMFRAIERHFADHLGGRSG
ncbi:dipeptidyl aminopeptidase/acylaminoacyl peptidase [Amycolatopsis sulphurea]|uniref:Dipeptidyl aminopeptidase/acylaminoacyl peptidase n=1 Tax=Amycolatopsis sulphurea TaxID=76022 RepID=A0A2A9FI50_9PSEU|nr:alpha/beta fold hydrolase [Amycolatopsis sulphurea]PFG50252.1 dipeptidyl aminopeptidase/acylaminoacyl peptidase [Amycolatopsis sulphurea]